MTKYRALIILVVLLLTLNIGLLILMSLKHPPPNRNSPKQVIIETLQLDKKQVVQYEVMLKEHRQAIKELNDQLLEKKNQFFGILNEEEYTGSEKSLIEEISFIQSEIELTHFNHFKDIKVICSSAQLPNFEKLTYKIQQIFNTRLSKKGPKKP